MILRENGRLIPSTKKLIKFSGMEIFGPRNLSSRMNILYMNASNLKSDLSTSKTLDHQNSL